MTVYTYRNDGRTFCIRQDVPGLSLKRIDNLGTVFQELSKMIFGKRIKKTFLKPLMSYKTCKFITVFQDEQYDPEFINIILATVTEAAIAMSYFKGTGSVSNDSVRKAKMYWAMYMERQKETMDKIKKEYAEVPIN